MKVAIIGFGSAGKRHAMSVLQLGCEVVSWDPMTKREPLAQWLDSEPGVTHAIISSPPDIHFEQTLLCLHQRLHVLVEKPLALSSTDAQMLCDVAQENDVRLAVGCQLRFLPSFEKTREDFLEHRNVPWIGQCVFGYDIRRWHPPSAPYLPRIGVLREVGTHELDLLCWLFGQLPDAATHIVQERHAVWGDEPSMFEATLLFRNTVVRLHLDYTSPLYQRNILLSSEQKYLVWALDPAKDAEDLQRASAAMLETFLQGESSEKLATGQDAVHVLKLIEQMEAVRGIEATV